MLHWALLPNNLVAEISATWLHCQVGQSGCPWLNSKSKTLGVKKQNGINKPCYKNDLMTTCLSVYLAIYCLSALPTFLVISPCLPSYFLSSITMENMSILHIPTFMDPSGKYHSTLRGGWLYSTCSMARRRPHLVVWEKSERRGLCIDLQASAIIPRDSEMIQQRAVYVI